MITDKMQLLRKNLRYFMRELTAQTKDNTDCCGVTVAQCHALTELEELDSTSISNLAQILKLDQSTLSRTIDGLVNTGLVSRIENADDRRCVCITLTEQGKKTVTEINKLYDNALKQILDKIPEQKQENIIEALSLITMALQELEKQCCA